jgi:3-dehydroquinate dehydratase-2
MTARLRPEGAARWRIGVINGPNMPNLGRRDQAIYGPIRSLADLERYVADFADASGVEVHHFSSNHEGEILDFIHLNAAGTDAWIINPAGLTTYGEATRHALSDSGRPYVEVHFANISRHFQEVSPGHTVTSRFTHTAAGLTMGLRQHGYLGALLALSLSLDDPAFLGGRLEAEESPAR